ncbi:hypothetical protein PsorP6_016777 [Peronosclerospora sorghi]|uniref:Uncharacterized protein n=1 Tax=Peronosclerospora sorghi TaxID=230839 RepID=A0ACC0WD43_9STRA|nr:hypothetical protein PsorP6_016777 [Peronosclerospora sorghi]
MSPRAREKQQTADAVTYTSHDVWLTGFLKFGESFDNCDTLHLCDCNYKVPSILVDPRPQLVDQLVLIKRWVLVYKAFGGIRRVDSTFLEIHDKEPFALLPTGDLNTKWTQMDVLQVLETRYKMKDLPMYTDTEPWAAIAARWQGNKNSSPFVSESDELPTVREIRKRKRIHAVFGRVMSVSPISRQKNHKSSHFFADIESVQSSSESPTQSLVNVMFTSVNYMRWHLFLRPGKIVLVTDLVKVLSRECNMFLLQITHGPIPAHDVVASETKFPQSLIFVWNDSISARSSPLTYINDSLRNFSMSNILRCSGKLIDFEGKVCRLVWDECIQVQGSDGTKVVLSLFRFPYEQELVLLRKGTDVRICDAHVLRWPTPVGGSLVIGLCPRSHFAITAFADPSSPCIVVGSRSRRSRIHKKWSCLGDFHSQSMMLSMWLLELLQLLDRKFFFGENEQKQPLECSDPSFSKIQRRRVAAQVAKQLRLSLRDGRNNAAVTLGTFYLECHSAKPDNCITLELPFHERLLTCTRAVTIRELQLFAKSKLNSAPEAIFDGVKMVDAFQSTRISSNELDWCLLLACIRGNVNSGDLELYDRTGSISVRLRSSEVEINPSRKNGLYLIRGFDLVVEDYNQLSGLQPEDEVPSLVCISCSLADLELVSFNDELTGNIIEETGAVDVQEVEQIVFLVSHVDALPLSTAGRLPKYRVFHGIICPVGENLEINCFMKSVCTAEILINAESTNWYIQKGFCYRIQAIKVSTTHGTSFQSVEDVAVQVSIKYCEKLITTERNNTLCFQSLMLFQGEDVNSPQCPFRVYRVENGQIDSIKLECDGFDKVRCKLHALCHQSAEDVCGPMAVSMNDSSTLNESTNRLNAKHLAKPTSVQVNVAELIGVAVLKYFLQQSEKVKQVSNLMIHPLVSSKPQYANDDKNCIKEPQIVMKVDRNLHTPHIISIVGKVTKKRYYWSNAKLPDIIGLKRELGSSLKRSSSRRLMCKVYVRDLQHLDTVEILIDASRFGIFGTIERGNTVEFSRLQSYITRSSYKTYLKWCHLSACRQIFELAWSIQCDAELFGSMRTTFLNSLYNASSIDRRVHRYLVGVMHVNYMVLKRKCRLCHETLWFDKLGGYWKHRDEKMESRFSKHCIWRWHELIPSNHLFQERTYMETNVRCIIDDGSGQAELYLERDVAWELFLCTKGQRLRFEHILSNYVDELSYFAGHSASGFSAISKIKQEQEYYQNELRAFILDAMPSLRSIVVFAQQFYSTKQKERTSVLTFGKDIQITTTTAPLPTLEAKRIDQVHVKNELKRRLVDFRLCMDDNHS